MTKEEKRAYNKAWNDANPDKVRAYSRKKYWDDPAKSKAHVKAWHIANPAKSYALGRRRTLKKYGLTVATCKAMEAKQGGKCAICRGPLGRFHIDHKPSGGEHLVRGLLCHACNIGLSFLDSPLRDRAISYVLTDGASCRSI